MKARTVTASALDQRVILQQPDISYDEIGGQVVSWQDVATLWASIEPLRGREIFENRRFEARSTVRIVMRYRNDVDERKRLKKGSVIYHILQVLNRDERNHTLEILAEVKK